MLNVDTLLADAREQTGLSDLGDDRIMDGLHRLVDAINAEAGLHERGEDRWRGELTQTLANRMRVEDWLAKHPDLLEQPVERPMFVFGLPRTGTTLTINLLNADPARRGFIRWEALHPIPPAGPGELSSDPRYHAEQEKLEMTVKYAPHIAAMHYEDADSPTECQYAMIPSFVSQYYDSNLAIPSYHKWFLYEADYRPAFDYHKRLLQLMQGNNPGRWTLKNPWHPLFLDDLTNVYPDAQLVMTHRDPADVVGSACSLVHAVRVMFSDDIDAEQVGRDLVETFDLMIERTIAFREKHGVDAIHDIQYADQLADPISEMERLYARFDEPFTAEAKTAMTNYLAANPKGKHGKHEYSLADYGLTREGVHAHFKDYIERFEIPVRA